MDYSKHVSTRATSQRDRTPGRTDEVENSEGGFVYTIGDWARLDRFLILGSEGGTYYATERELTKNNAGIVIKLIQSDGMRVLHQVIDISESGRAHKNDAALFVVAAALKLGNVETRQFAAAAAQKVARTGGHLLQLVKFVEAFGGWGRATKNLFQHWYGNHFPNDLGYQLLKYRQRDGWSHRDILRLAHPKAMNLDIAAIFDVTAHPETLFEGERVNSYLPPVYEGFRLAHGVLKNSPDPEIVERYELSWEMLPTEWLTDQAVNRQLLKTMPLMATIRQLGKMSANGTMNPLSIQTKMVIERLTNQETITKSKIHPMHYLLAIKNYFAGKGFRGSLTWKTDGRIIDALNKGFYMSFANVETTGKAFMLGIDVSSSMTQTMGDSNISAAEAAGAMAMVIAKTEPKHYMHGFTRNDRWYHCAGGTAGFVDLGISSNDSLDSVMQKVQKSNFGSTDCAIPMLYATERKLMVDTFVVLTDSETYAGSIKPSQALQQYRRHFNPQAKLVVVGMASNGFTIADPNDAGMLDVVGFDASVLPVIAEFSK